MMLPEQLNIHLLYDPAIVLRGIYPKKVKAETQTDICTPLFLAALFTIAKRWHQHTNGLTKCGIYIQWNIIQPKKGMQF